MTRDELISANIGLVYACARRFIGKGADYEDLCSAGCVGLIKAVDRFDESRGCTLSTYAVPVILGEMRLLFREGGSVKLSRSLQELSRKAKAVADGYRSEHGAEIKMTELAKELGTDVYKAQEALNASLAVMSLSRDDEGGEGCIDVPVPSAEEELTDRLSLRQAMDTLDAGDRELIRLRYFGRKTQSETAKVLNTTQVQISRREKKILLKLRMMLV